MLAAQNVTSRSAVRSCGLAACSITPARDFSGMAELALFIYTYLVRTNESKRGNVLIKLREQIISRVHKLWPRYIYFFSLWPLPGPVVAPLFLLSSIRKPNMGYFSVVYASVKRMLKVTV